MNRIITIGFVLCVTACVPLAVYSNSLVEKSNLVEVQRGTVYSKEQAIKCQTAISKANQDAAKLAHFPAYLTKSEEALLNRQVEDKCDVGKYSNSDLGAFPNNDQGRQETVRDGGTESKDH